MGDKIIKNIKEINLMDEYKEDRKKIKNEREEKKKIPKLTAEEKKERKRLYQKEYMKTYLANHKKKKQENNHIIKTDDNEK